MKHQIILAALIVALAPPSNASNKENTCRKTDFMSQMGAATFKCVDGNWKHTGLVGNTRVEIAVELIEGDKTLASSTLFTMDGQPTNIGMGNVRTYISKAKVDGPEVVTTPDSVKEGFYMAMTPTLIKDRNDKMELDFVAKHSEIISISNFRVENIEVQLPQVKTFELKSKIDLENGKAIYIPFGPIIDSLKSMNHTGAFGTQYILKITATSNKKS